jgi:hypothetical protein
VPDPLNAQAWNRYSYVINNPLAFTDPNGYCFLGMCSWGKGISTFFGRSFGVLFRKFPILGNLLEIAAVLLCPASAGLTCTVSAAFLSTTFVAGVTSGNLGYALKAGLIAAATAVAFYEVGNATDAIAGNSIGSHIPPGLDHPDAFAFNVAGHALVGCGQAVASGGKCGPAALAGAVGSAAAPSVSKLGFEGGLVATSVLGGLASVAGGGKFANGAITAAFGYLFNACAGHPGDCTIGDKANAVVNGGYSIFPGVGNALSEWARYAGLMGSDEFWRADQESRVIGGAIEEAWKHPKAAWDLSVETFKDIDESEPLFRYYLGGRMLMGLGTGLGPFAAYGDTLAQVNTGHTFLDSIVKGGVGGGVP